MNLKISAVDQAAHGLKLVTSYKVTPSTQEDFCYLTMLFFLENSSLPNAVITKMLKMPVFH